MFLFQLPPDYPRIKRVTSFQELVTTRFTDNVNALCWERGLPGDFNEVVSRLDASQGVTPLDETQLLALPLGASVRAGIAQMIEDQRLLRGHGLSPRLDSIQDYPRDENAGPVPTDVYSFHVDSATVETDTYLCTYYGPASEGLRNEQARRRVDIPETRAELLRLFGGEDNADFDEYLKENCYDLHYVPLPHARPFSFGVGNLWRIAVQYAGSPGPPCIHRAPETLPGEGRRLLLIS
jgi:hypothetical protein